MRTDDHTLAARAFARSLNVLLKYVRLYGSEHKLTAAQFEIAWSELNNSLRDQNFLLLGQVDGRILIDGAPLEGGISEKTLAQVFSAASISSLQFTPATTRDDFQNLVRCFASLRPGNSHSDLARMLGNSTAIKLNSVRFIPEDSSAPSSAILQGIASRVLGGSDQLQDLVKDPNRIIQLIAAAEGSRGNGGDTGNNHATSADAVHIDQPRFAAALQLLLQMAQTTKGPAAENPAQVQLQLAGTPGDASQLVNALLSSVAKNAEDRPDTPLLIRIAEHLAIRFAMQAYERGEVRVNAVREMLERMSRNMQELRSILSAHEERMNRAGMIVDHPADILDRQFWAAMPEKGKRSVLLSNDGWCIPARNVRSYVTELLTRGDREIAVKILNKYLDAIAHPNVEARRRSASGLPELGETLAAADPELLARAIDTVGSQLSRETIVELQSLQEAAFVRLGQTATHQHNFIALESACRSLRALEKDHATIARHLRPRIAVESRLREYLDEALAANVPPPALVHILQLSPYAVVAELSVRLQRSSRRDECGRIVRLASIIGDTAVQYLRNQLRSGNFGDAMSSVGLLSHLDPALLDTELASRLAKWPRFYQMGVLRQLAAGSSPQRGRMLLNLLSVIDPLLLPAFLEELALVEEEDAAQRLKLLADGDSAAGNLPFLRVKAIEALGALRRTDAIPVLNELASGGGLRAWRFPREIRIAASQALAKCGSGGLRTKTGLDPIEFGLGPLDGDSGWVRSRRYQRVRPAEPITAIASTSRGRSRVELNLLSLGGGQAVADSALPIATEALLEVPLGFSKLRSRIVVCATTPVGFGFEILDMPLPDRSRLRHLLASELRRAGNA